MTILLTDDIVLTEDDFKTISRAVYDHCGINLHMGKKELVRARMAKLLRQKGFRSFSDYIRFVMNDRSGAEFTVLIDALSTNLTSFFRENQHFDYLRTSLLPQLLARRSHGGKTRIRGWSAGCSSGEEHYSIAITLLESLPASGTVDAMILATDIANSKLDIARKGSYDSAKVEPVPADIRLKYFVKTAKRSSAEYELCAAVKNLVCFRYLNLMEPWPVKGPIDFIFCRNSVFD